MTINLPENAPSEAPTTGMDGDLSSAVRSESERSREPLPPAVEIGGRKGPDPTRYGDWEKNGRCIDF
jgi:hypothetical protein